MLLRWIICVSLTPILIYIYTVSEWEWNIQVLETTVPCYNGSVEELRHLVHDDRFQAILYCSFPIRQ